MCVRNVRPVEYRPGGDVISVVGTSIIREDDSVWLDVIANCFQGRFSLNDPGISDLIEDHSQCDHSKLKEHIAFCQKMGCLVWPCSRFWNSYLD